MSDDVLDDLIATEDYLNDDGGVDAPSYCTGDSIVLCPVCQRGDVWQEAVNRTEYVYKGEAVKNGQEVIDYLLAEVSTLLETQNAQGDSLPPRKGNHGQ